MEGQSEYNLVINGKKITDCNMHELCAITNYESPEWKDIIKREVVWTAQINDEEIGEATMEYYMHRKNRYYFRNKKRDKICIQIDVKLPCGLRYGDYVNITMTFA